MSYDPLNIDDCTDAASIRAKLAELREMGAYNFDLVSRIHTTKIKLKKRLADLGEGQD